MIDESGLKAKAVNWRNGKVLKTDRDETGQGPFG
jgi:hypothetical protein